MSAVGIEALLVTELLIRVGQYGSGSRTAVGTASDDDVGSSIVNSCLLP